MTQDINPKNKAALVDVINKERHNLESLIAGLTDSLKVLPGVEGDWSIKDIMAHIATWEQLAYDRIHTALTDEPIKFPVIKGDDDLDRFNAEIYEKNKSLPLDKIQAEFQESHQVLLKLIDSLEEDFIPQKLLLDWSGNLTVQVLISSNTHWHYIEHMESIVKFLQNQSE